MPPYVHLPNYAQGGLANIGDHDLQHEEVIESLGVGEVNSLYQTLGQYDTVAVTDFPDDKTAAQFSRRMSWGGHSEAETPRAFSEEETEEIIEILYD